MQKASPFVHVQIKLHTQNKWGVYWHSKKCVFPFRSVYSGKYLPYKGKLSLNKLDVFPLSFCLKITMGKIILKARQDMIIAQENINPDFGSLSLWIGYQLQISLGFHIKIAMVKLLQAPSPHYQRHHPFSSSHPTLGQWKPLPSFPWRTKLGTSHRRSRGWYTFTCHQLHQQCP